MLRRIPISEVPELPSSRFTPRTAGGQHNEVYPWKSDENDYFVKRLTKGWRVIGRAKNSSLDELVRRYEGSDGKYGRFIAVMFRDADGFDHFFHMSAGYDYVFEETE